MDRKNITIQHVARVAGVSTATVSRTLSKPALVAEATRTAVLNAIAETGYRLNATASNLRRQRTGTVIVLLPNIANAFFPQILAGLSAVLAPAGYGMLIADTQSDPDPQGRLEGYLAAGRADGLIILDGTLSPDALDAPRRVPAVALCEWTRSAIPSIRVENGRGAALAVEHLVALGHSAVGHVTGPPDNVLTRARRRGYDRALAAFGVPARSDWIVEGDFAMDSGAAAGRDWLAMPERPTAMFLSSDEMAVGFIGAVQRAGLSVPRDVSVVGFDDIEIARHMTPSLTTIRQPRWELGRRAAEFLLDMIAQGTLEAPSEVIGVEFIERSSSGPPPS